MANRYGKDYIVLMGKESAYGTAQTTPTKKFACKMVATPFANPIEIKRNNMTLEPQIQDMQKGTTGGTVELSGELTLDMEILLQAMLMDAGTPYVFPVTTSNYSYTIYKAFPASDSDAGDGDKCVGCRIESLSITGSQGGAIAFTATFRAQSVDLEVDLSGLTLTSITDCTAPTTAAFLFQDVTASILDTAAITHLQSFTFTLTAEFAGDEVSYQNSQTRIQDIVCKITGTLECTWLYDTTNDALVYDNLVGSVQVTDIITLVSGAHAWAITTEGYYMTYSLPDPDQCIFQSSFTKQLLGAKGVNALSIAVT